MNITEIIESIANLKPEYYRDENGEANAFICKREKIIAVPIQSGAFETIIQLEVRNTQGRFIGPRDFTAFKMMCKLMAEEAPPYPLPVRVGSDGDDIIYELRSEDGTQVRIAPTGYEVVPQQAVFRDVGIEASIPRGEASIDILYKYLNISDPEQRLLAVITFISWFIPEISHPILVLYGEQGSAKTTMSTILKRIIDPSNIDVSHLTNDVRDCELTLENNWVTAFDNLSGLSNAMSDFLCGVVTGQAFQRRRFYTQDQLKTVRLRRCVILNGISGVATRPDLLDRCVLIELKRISKDDRKQESEIFVQLDKEMPLITGAIFNLLSKAIAIHRVTKFDTGLGRLTDFYAWGICISEAMGIGGKRFVEAYENNNQVIATEIIDTQPLLEPLINYMGTLELPLEIQISDFFKKFKAYASVHSNDYINRHLPPTHNRFSLELKKCLGIIEEQGFIIDYHRKAEGSFVKISEVGHMMPTPVDIDAKKPDEGQDVGVDPKDAA
jgi:hypothetical protein